MNKEQILQALRELAANRQITQEEMNSAFFAGLSGVFAGKNTSYVPNQMSTPVAMPVSDTPVSTPSTSFSFKQHLSLAKVLYAMGILVVVVGILTLLIQNWSWFSSIVRIMITLGSSVALFVAGVLLAQKDHTKTVSLALMTMASIILPTGITVLFYENGFNLASFKTQVVMTAILTVVYLGFLQLYKNVVFAFFSLLSGTFLFYSLAFFLLQGTYFFGSDTFSWIVVVAGISHMFLGYFISTTEKRALTTLLYFVGSIEIFGPLVRFGDFWDILYPLVIFGILYLSTRVKSRALLVTSSLFLVGYLFKVTGLYFADIVSWPIALIIAGFMLIGVGYLAVYLNKTYIKSA